MDSPYHASAPLDGTASVDTRIGLDTAAAHATPHVPIAEPSDRIGDVRRMLEGYRYDSASHIAVCTGGRFVGLVTIEDVLSAAADQTLESLMDRAAPVVTAGIDQEIAAWRAVSHRESALAVVDQGGRFVGMIPPHELIAVLLAEHEEDLSRLGGFLKNASPARTTSEEPVHRRFWHRLPWLLVGLCGVLVTADLVGQFEQQLRVNVMVAFFMPGIVYLADAVGTQTEMIIVRGLSLGVPIGRMVGRELAAVVAIGLALATVTTPLVWWLWADTGLALSVGVSVFVASATATAVGVLLPWIFDQLRIDPAVGSGPLATVIQDLLSIWIYLTVAALLI
jgi:magnesium transporter